jgi:glycosyltransferase involved in cell wall biosynthesis
VTYLFQGRLGKNVALNTGLAHLEGDLAVFTDDDVFPHSDWLIRMRAAADDHQSYSMFGGVVLPRWEGPPPDWVRWVPAGPAFTLTDPGMTEGPIYPYFVFGPNMAIRAEVFRSGICFDTSIGPTGSNYAMGSETELMMRLGQQGYKAWHVRDCVVEHFIRKYQMDKSWVSRRAIRYGRGQFRLSGAVDSAAIPRLFGIPLDVFPELLRQGVKIVRARLSFNEQAAFLARWWFNYYLGQVIEARLIRRQQCPYGDMAKEGQ